jgi:hypothetical protein
LVTDSGDSEGSPLNPALLGQTFKPER